MGRCREKNRKSVLKYYGLGVILFFILFGISTPKVETDKVTNNNTQTDKEVAKKAFELSDSDKELLKNSYDTFNDEQVSRFSEIENKYKSLDESVKQEIKPDIDRLVSERTSIKEAKEAEKKAKAEEDARIKAEQEAAAKEAKKQAEAQKYNTGITRNDMARDKSGLKGSFVKFSGKIIQVMNGKGYNQYRMAVDGNHDQVILIEVDAAKLTNNILEDDYITVEGVSAGNQSYKTVLGAEMTIPGVVVDNFYY